MKLNLFRIKQWNNSDLIELCEIWFENRQRNAREDSTKFSVGSRFDDLHHSSKNGLLVFLYLINRLIFHKQGVHSFCTENQGYFDKEITERLLLFGRSLS